jgi:two-component system alkaline phosphatase synthesis response regulator PhoP
MIRSVLRRKTRATLSDDEILSIHDIRIDPGRHKVYAGKKQIDLTATEFRLLQYLARHPGWVFSRYQIVDAIKGDDYPVTERAVDVQIVGLRKKLGSAGKLIETVRGVGYRLKDTHEKT